MFSSGVEVIISWAPLVGPTCRELERKTMLPFPLNAGEKFHVLCYSQENPDGDGPYQKDEEYLVFTVMDRMLYEEGPGNFETQLMVELDIPKWVQGPDARNEYILMAYDILKKVYGWTSVRQTG